MGIIRTEMMLLVRAILKNYVKKPQKKAKMVMI